MAQGELSVQQIKSKRTGYLIMSTLVLLFLGLLYAFSMFRNPMTEDFGLVGDVALTFNIMMIMFCVGATLGSVLEKKIGVKGNLILCAILFAVGFCGTGFLGEVTSSTVALYVFYGIIGGAGVGLGYNTIVATTNVWFPDKVGFSSGVLMMGFGVSALIFGNLALAIRPMLGGMGSVLIAIGVIVAILTVILAFFLQRPPSNIVELLLPEKATAATAEDPHENDNIFKTPIFYIYYIWGVIVIAIGLATIGAAAQDAVLVGVDASFAPMLVGLVSTANGLSRIVIGFIYDKTNVKVTMLIDALIALVATVLIVAAFSASIPAAYIVGALLCGFAYGGVPVIASAFSRQRYGAKKYPFNLSIVNFSIAFGSILNIILGAVIGVENRLMIFIVLTVFAVIAVVDVFFFSKKWNKDIEQA